MTDVIGVRVITTYAHGVQAVADRLRSKYEVDERNSVDKTSALNVDRFGYRDIHLVLRLGKTGELGCIREILEKVKIEVQIRSVLEHAWAEIEHELR
jgi:ppGpp synthetase/RelA/SpoT-type nucleotidyltranferase